MLLFHFLLKLLTLNNLKFSKLEQLFKIICDLSIVTLKLMEGKSANVEKIRTDLLLHLEIFSLSSIYST